MFTAWESNFSWVDDADRSENTPFLDGQIRISLVDPEGGDASRLLFRVRDFDRGRDERIKG